MKTLDLIYPKTRAIIGLGNVGERFDLTPHNIGFAALDALAKSHGVQFEEGKMKSALVAEIKVADYTVLLVKPSTGMNDSGDALAELLNDMNFDFPQITVIFDDLSFGYGRMKFKNNGRGTAGHRGVESLLKHVPEHRLVTRLKVGVGPDPGGANRFKYVLSPVEGDAVPVFNKVAEAAGAAAVYCIEHGLDQAMCVYNSKDVMVG